MDTCAASTSQSDEEDWSVQASSKRSRLDGECASASPFRGNRGDSFAQGSPSSEAEDVEEREEGEQGGDEEESEEEAHSSTVLTLSDCLQHYTAVETLGEKIVSALSITSPPRCHVVCFSEMRVLRRVPRLQKAAGHLRSPRGADTAAEALRHAESAQGEMMISAQC